MTVEPSLCYCLEDFKLCFAVMGMKLEFMFFLHPDVFHVPDGVIPIFPSLE